MAWSAPTTAVLDNFNRANGALGANWSTLTGSAAGRVLSNAATAVATGGLYSEAWWNPASFTGDGEVYLTVPVIDATSTHQLFLDMFQGWSTSSTAALSGYQMVLNRAATNDTFQVFKYTNGGFAQQGSTVTISGHVAAGDLLAMTRETSGANSVINMWRSLSGSGTWTQQGSTITDSTSPFFTAGQSWQVGWGVFGTFSIDDFGGGTIVTASASLPEVVMAPRIPTY